MKVARNKLRLLGGFVICLSFSAGSAVPAQEQNAPAIQAPGTPSPAAQTPPSASPATQAAPKAAQEHNNVRPAAKWQRFDYTCEDNAKIVVYLHDDSVKVYYRDHLYFMRQTPAASGTRYSDGKVVWWSKGDNGFLQEEDTAVSEGQKLAKDCYQAPSPAEAVNYSTVTGTLTYLVRMALPAQAVVQVQLLDLSREQAESDPRTLVAEEKFTLGQRGVPLPFALKVDAAKIDAKHTYGVSARISLMGEVKFATKEPYKVLTQGNPAKVDIVLLPAGKP